MSISRTMVGNPVQLPAQPKVLGIMQPYFFPYFEQFRLIAACDLWVVFDIVKYSRKSWINRNKVLNREKGTAYISVPVKHAGLDVAIKDALLDVSQNWRDDLLNKLKGYKKRAPHFDRTMVLVMEAIEGEHTSLSALNTTILCHMCQALEIQTPIVLASELPIVLPIKVEPDEWALHISKALNAVEYRNSAGGKSFFDASKYFAQGIKLSFHEHIPRSYHTADFEFVPDLSIIDWLMWNDLATLKEWLN